MRFTEVEDAYTVKPLIVKQFIEATQNYVMTQMRVEGGTLQVEGLALRVGGEALSLAGIGRILVVGGGKGAGGKEGDDDDDEYGGEDDFDEEEWKCTFCSKMSTGSFCLTCAHTRYKGINLTR